MENKKTLKEIFNHHLETASDVAMEDALCIMSNFVEDMRTHHPHEVEEMLCEVHEALSPYISEEEAHEIVAGFVNSDGTHGPHWTYEQTQEAAHKFGVNLEGKNFRCYDWFVVLNMVYSDYYHSGWSLETYIELAKDFLHDKDFTKPGKAKWYFHNKEEYLS